MKKLMTMTAVVCAAVAAQAVSSYTYINVAQYAGKAQQASYYTFYTLSQSEARTAMGASEQVTYETYAAWLGQNFAENSATTAAYKGYVASDLYSDVVDTVFVLDGSGGYTDTGALYDAIVVGLYDNGTDKAYNVFANTSSAIWEEDLELYIYDGREIALDTTNPSTGWIAVKDDPEPIPEPTSGLLLLMGLAGLALRRKQG